MKLTQTLGLILPALMLAGCGGPDTAEKAERRAAINAQVFPDPADRQGILLAFPLESGGIYPTLLLDWYPDQVSQQVVTGRVFKYCKGQRASFTGVGIKNDYGSKTATLHTGETKTVRSVMFRCLS